jgi:hypothetical protein
MYPEEYATNARKDTWVIRDFCQDYLVPLEGLLCTAYDLVYICNLKKYLRQRNKRLYFLKCL